MMGCRFRTTHPQFTLFLSCLFLFTVHCWISNLNSSPGYRISIHPSRFHYEMLQQISQRQHFHSLLFAGEPFYDEGDDVTTLQSITIYEVDSTNHPSASLIADFLMELGAVSTSIVNSSNSSETTKEKDITTCDVTASFSPSIDLNIIIKSLNETLFHERDTPMALSFPMYAYNTVSFDPNEQEKLQYEKPVYCSGFVLKLPWHSDADVDRTLSFHNKDEIHAGDVSLITMQGGVAFGSMADHPTTRLCLDFLRQNLNRTKHRWMLDYGAGCGILGLAACALGEIDRVVGVEIDVDAVPIANLNAKVNNFEDKMRVYLPKIDNICQSNADGGDRESLSVALVGTGSRKARGDVIELPDEYGGPIYDICVANILPNALISLVSVIAGFLKSDAELVLSGITVDKSNDVIQAFGVHFYDCHVFSQIEKWVLIRGRRK